jgi:hypothetical protein
MVISPGKGSKKREGPQFPPLGAGCMLHVILMKEVYPELIAPSMSIARVLLGFLFSI